MTSEQPCVDVLIADLVLPGLSGAELAAEILERCPRAKMIFMSGSQQPALLDSSGLIERQFLQKPYTAEVIVAAVREALC
jgi:DNA-binding NarL/FixJ family response regulator